MALIVTELPKSMSKMSKCRRSNLDDDDDDDDEKSGKICDNTFCETVLCQNTPFRSWFQKYETFEAIIYSVAIIVKCDVR